MIRIALCDDDKPFLTTLSSIIRDEFKKYTNDFEVKCFSNGVLLLNENSHEKFDVLFLDIDMPEISGFDIARSIRQAFSNCFIIFITSHSELVYQSFDFQPFNFIRKEAFDDIVISISKIISKLMINMKQNENIILEDEISGRVAVYYRNIIYIKSNKHYLYYYIQDHEEPLIIRGSINDAEIMTEPYDFIRIHRSCIVNPRFISKIDFNIGKVMIRYNTEIKSLSMSRSYKNSVDEKYTLYLRKTL